VPVLSLGVYIRDRTVGMGSAEGTEEGAEDLEQAGNTVIEFAEDTGAVGAQDTEKLADMGGWKLPNFPI